MNPFRHFGRTPWIETGPLQGLYLHRTARGKHGHASMPWVGFEPMIPLLKQCKTHILETTQLLLEVYKRNEWSWTQLALVSLCVT